MSRSGHVWHRDRKVGRLRDADRGELLFAYDPEWLAGDAFPVSISLPLEYGDAEVPALGYFEGLLPEGAARKRICRQHKISEDDTAGLLFAIGGDCAGALSILPGDEEPASAADEPVDLSSEKLAELVRTAGAARTVSEDRPRRFSLAGAQEKLPVIVTATGLALSDTANPSSHILKFETERWVCFSEVVTNRLAQAVGLPGVNIEYRELPDGDDHHPYLLIERYDRVATDDGFARLHQEDMAQAQGLPSALKYQKDGGPSLGEIIQLVRDHGARPVEMVNLIRDWQIFNLLVGNWDGHAKNLAFLYRPGEGAPLLAPFYDLVSIELFNLVRSESWSRDMALAVGSDFIPERIGRGSWEAMAKACGLRADAVKRRVEELAEIFPERAAQVVDAFQAEHGEVTIAPRFVEMIERRCRFVRG